MNAKDFIKQKFASVGITLTDADLLQMKVKDEEVTTDKIDNLHITFVKSIPMILLRPTSISEGGVAISRANKDDIMTYYANECKRLGLKDELTKKPKVRFR